MAQQYGSKSSSITIACPNCGGHHVSFAATSFGVAKCDDCGFSQSELRIAQSGGNSGDLLGAIFTIGAIVLGAVVVGAILDSLDPPKGKALPRYDE
jgi:ribosomal protein S27E